MTIAKSQFKFRKHEHIGTEGAEEDQDFLFDCFVDTGDITALRDTSHPARVVEGRTGSGKTALLMNLKHLEEHVTFIDPESLSLQFISNSNVIKFLENNGVNLDLFYRLLWKHILIVELIKQKFNINNEQDQRGFLSRIYDRYISNNHKKEAYEYLTEWGQKFWKNTEERIKEVTRKLENDIRANIEGKIPNFSSSISSGEKFSDEEKLEITTRAQEVVNSVQIQKLSKIIKTLSEDEFTDRKIRYYIVIDKLDEKWVDDSIRYKLIRALIEAVKDLKRIQTAKIIVALRKDLIERVFNLTRDAGFQEEKYQSLFLKIYWKDNSLIEMIEKRLNSLIKRQYTNKEFKWNEVISSKVGKVPTNEYVLSRTMYRPRDVISFINNCINKSVGFSNITATRIRDAETNYSEIRFRALGDEWISDYPNLLKFMNILKGRNVSFNFDDITKEEIDSIVVEILSSDVKESCEIEYLCHRHLESNMPKEAFLAQSARILYKVGAIGIRTPNRGISWSFKEENIFHESQINGTEKVEICPMFYRVLGIG